jgi:hypothetical protein
LEVIPGLDEFFPSANSGGDVPEVAVVVTYLIVLPGILTGVNVIGALVGILLCKLFRETLLGLHDNEHHNTSGKGKR